MLVRLLRAPATWIVLGIAIGTYFLAQWVDAVGGPVGIRERFGVLAPLVTGSLQLALTPTPVPTDVFAMAHGTLYGFWFAAPLNWLVWWLAALFEYGVGRRARADLDLGSELRRLPNWLRRFPVGHPGFLILGRQIPWAGGHLTTIVPGGMGVPFRRVAWCSAIAIVPGAFFYAALGAGLLRL